MKTIIEQQQKQGHSFYKNFKNKPLDPRPLESCAPTKLEKNQILTVSEVAAHLKLNWKTVKNIDKYFLEKSFGTTEYGDLS
ncbi:MAG: transposase family protein, partial [Thermodesulfobacteriota bacterium]|nr:transposase family protein [Thermodesulfobacteriota bacterium]